MGLNDSSLIGELCKGFDDETENHEVMFGLVHAIEKFDDKIYLKQLSSNLQNMLPHASEWLEILHYRILNNAETRRAYPDILSSLENENKDYIIGLLKKIKKEDPVRFNDSVNEILNSL